MLNLANERLAVKHKPAVSKDYFLGVLNKVEQMYTNEMANKDRVINVGKIYKPLDIKRYDIVTNMVCNQPHPCIVYKVTEQYVYTISFSTTDAPHNVYKLAKSRIFGTSWLTNTVVRMSHEDAVARFVGIMDNKKEADAGFAAIKKLYKDIFNF